MCGIAGFLQFGLKSEEWRKLLYLMTDSLAHRGPDDSDILVRSQSRDRPGTPQACDFGPF